VEEYECLVSGHCPTEWMCQVLLVLRIMNEFLYVRFYVLMAVMSRYGRPGGDAL
jgi:hypothetical protein